MPHIELYGCDLTRNITEISVSVVVRFSKEYYKLPKAGKKLKEMQKDLEAVMDKYSLFDEEVSRRWLCDEDFDRERQSD